MRREDRSISKNEAIEVLRAGEFGVLSICGSNNEGYGIPLNYALVDHEIYFHCATEGSKLEYLRINNKVSFCVVGSTKLLPSDFGILYESAIVSGIISEINGDAKREALRQLVAKYAGDYLKEGEDYINTYFEAVKILRLSIESITGKARRK